MITRNRIRLLGWSAKGLRCPDHTINLEGEGGHLPRVALIQMPNGTGKTTTLVLLRAALSGVGPSGEWTPDAVRAMRKRPAGSSHGVFEVRLSHNDHRLTFGLRFDFELGAASYYTTSPSGRAEGFDPPRELVRYLQPKFVRLFVFDGEFADHLLKQQYTDAQMAIDELFQLRRLEEMAACVRAYWSQVVAERGASAPKGLAQRRNRVERLESRLKMLEQECRQLESNKGGLEQSIIALKQKFSQDIEGRKKWQQAYVDVSSRCSRSEGRCDQLVVSLMRQIRKPHALHSWVGPALLQLRDGLDKAKLPENASREFFEDIAQESECICARPIDSVISAVIRERAQRYLGSDDVSVLNSMKEEIRSLVGSDSGAQVESTAKMASEVVRELDLLDQLRTEVENLQAQAAADDPALGSAKQEIEEFTAKLAEVNSKLQRYDDTTDDDDSYGIVVLKRRLRDANEQLAEITDTLRLRKQTEIAAKILTQSHAVARERLGAAVCEEANARIAELMPHNDIRIERIAQRLILNDRDAGSMGETLTVAYAFLATLFERGEHQLPIIVDSPAIPIDKAVRPRVAQLIPRLSKQYVAFTISTERDAFVRPLEAACGGDMRLFTLSRKGFADVGVAPSASDLVQETDDGMLVEGNEYFWAFHQENE